MHQVVLSSAQSCLVGVGYANGRFSTFGDFDKTPPHNFRDWQNQIVIFHEPFWKLCSGDNQITCPAHRCQAYVEDKLVFDLFSRPNNADDAQVVRKFKKLVVDGFVSKHRLTLKKKMLKFRKLNEMYFYRAMMFCSTPDCEVVVKMAGPDRFGTDKVCFYSRNAKFLFIGFQFGVEINCECGESLCSSCGNTWHDPVRHLF